MTATETTTPPAEIPAQAAPGTAREAVLRDQLSSLRGLLSVVITVDSVLLAALLAVSLWVLRPSVGRVVPAPAEAD